MHALYGFTRYADEIVDDLATTLDATGQAAALDAWGQRFFAGLHGAPCDDPVLPAVLHTVRAFDLDFGGPMIFPVNYVFDRDLVVFRTDPAPSWTPPRAGTGRRGGLRTYDQVVAWLRNPVVFAVEALLLVCMTWHGIAGVHAVLLDLGLRGRAERVVARVLLDVAVATVLYGLWLLYMIGFRG